MRGNWEDATRAQRVRSSSQATRDRNDQQCPTASFAGEEVLSKSAEGQCTSNGRHSERRRVSMIDLWLVNGSLDACCSPSTRDEILTDTCGI